MTPYLLIPKRIARVQSQTLLLKKRKKRTRIVWKNGKVFVCFVQTGKIRISQSTYLFQGYQGSICLSVINNVQ